MSRPPRIYPGAVLELSSLDLEEIAIALADQTNYERRAVEWLADNSLIDEEAADRFLTGHPDPDLP